MLQTCNNMAASLRALFLCQVLSISSVYAPIFCELKIQNLSSTALLYHKYSPFISNTCNRLDENMLFTVSQWNAVVPH